LVPFYKIIGQIYIKSSVCNKAKQVLGILTQGFGLTRLRGEFRRYMAIISRTD